MSAPAVEARMGWRRKSLALAVAAAALTALGWLARAPYHPVTSDAGVLRLSWRLRGERIEDCRARTQAELDALPVHMRTPEVCEGRLIAYRLVVRIDDAAPDSARVLPGGARGDRPVFVMREVPLRPGPHRVRLRFAQEGDTGDAAPPALAIDTVVHAAVGIVHLITLDPASARFVIRSASANP